MPSHKRTLTVIGGIAAFVILIIVTAILLYNVEANSEDEALAKARAEDAQEQAEKAKDPNSKKKKKQAEGILEMEEADYAWFDNIETYLLIGTDYSAKEQTADQEGQGAFADSLQLLIINKTRQTCGLVQIDRDTITEVMLLQDDGEEGITRDMQICTAHAYGGTEELQDENTKRAVETFFGGLPIDGYYTINKNDIPLLNHTIGGVEVTLEDDFTTADPAMKKGETLTLTDEQAAIYITGRMGIGDGTNTTRMSRQRTYIKAFADKAKEKMHEDAGFVNDVYRQMSDVANTDMNGNAISRITNSLLTFENKGILTMEGERTLGEYAGDGEEHVEIRVSEQEKIRILSQLMEIEEEE